MNPPPLYKICEFGQASLFMMPKPDSNQLDHDIQFYQSQGVNTVISLLLPDEMTRLGLKDEAEVCKKHGLEFIHFSVKDMDVPNIDALKSLNTQLKQKVENGHSIAIHCHGGRGRAGTVAITLMQELGYTASQATQLAQEGREDPNVPVCDIQRAFVKNYL